MVSMKKKIFSVCATLFCASVLAFLTVQTIRIDEKLAHVARPSRLFNPKLIENHCPPKKQWEVKSSSDLNRFARLICQQTLGWLGRGMQAVVFETQDQKYVVKFFQLGRLKDDEPRGFVRNLLSRESNEKRQERLAHREEIFSSSKMCFEELQDETGIVYVHLNHSKDDLKYVKVVDRYGQSHHIWADDTSFVVQKKARLLVPTLTSLMEKGQVNAAKGRIDQIFDLLLSLARKGFVDNDDALIRNNNMGLSDDRAIYIDTGHLYRAQNLDVAERMRYEFQIRLEPLEKWLNVMYPELGAYYKDRRDAIMAMLVQEKEQKMAPTAKGS